MKNSKKTLKERQIEVLTGNVEKWNRYVTWCRRKQWDFKANLSKANLSKADLSKADLSKANLRWADLSKANLSEANLSKANLSEANLSAADLRWANLSKADLSKADLSKANLREADLREADLRWADLSAADLREADLSKANLDFSSLPLWCGSLRMKTDTRLRKQIAYHLASLFVNSEEVLTDEEKQLLEAMKPFANQFHRVNECGKL